MLKMAAILKLFIPHLLPNRMSVWAETCLEASERHGECVCGVGGGGGGGGRLGI